MKVDKIPSLAICINIKAFNRVDTNGLNILKTCWSIWNFILLLTEFHSALKVV